MILITTSHRPTQRIRSFCHDLTRIIPNSIRMNRGKMNFEGIIDRALDVNANRLIVIEKWKRGFCVIHFYTLVPDVSRFYPILYLSSVKTQKDLGSRTTNWKKLVITLQHDPSTELSQVARALSHFIELPIEYLRTDLPYQALIHLSSIQKDWVKIALILFPIFKMIGPILIVKKIVWDHNEPNK